MSFTIDTNYNSWIFEIPEKERNDVCNKFLKLGYLTSNLCKTSINPEGTIFKNLNTKIQQSLSTMDVKNVANMKVIETKICENLDRVKVSIEKLTESNSKSI